MGKKVKVTLEIDSTLWKRFQHFVLDKYGKVWGKLSKEAEEAFKLYLEKNKLTSLFSLPKGFRFYALPFFALSPIAFALATIIPFLAIATLYLSLKIILELSSSWKL